MLLGINININKFKVLFSIKLNFKLMCKICFKWYVILIYLINLIYITFIHNQIIMTNIYNKNILVNNGTLLGNWYEEEVLRNATGEGRYVKNLYH